MRRFDFGPSSLRLTTGHCLSGHHMWSVNLARRSEMDCQSQNQLYLGPNLLHRYFYIQSSMILNLPLHSNPRDRCKDFDVQHRLLKCRTLKSRTIAHVTLAKQKVAPAKRKLGNHRAPKLLTTNLTDSVLTRSNINDAHHVQAHRYHHLRRRRGVQGHCDPPQCLQGKSRTYFPLSNTLRLPTSPTPPEPRIYLRMDGMEN